MKKRIIKKSDAHGIKKIWIILISLAIGNGCKAEREQQGH